MSSSGSSIDHGGVVSTLKRRRGVIVDAIRARLWPVPALGVLAAIIAGAILPAVDSRLNGHLPEPVSDHLFGGGADAAREVLGTIASALITVTSLTFSLTLVTMQLASSQYSPRLLRSFSSDRFVQRTLAMFLATFAYALTVLRTVRSGSGDDDEGTEFVPQISVTVAYALAMVSVWALVVFLGHLVRQIRIETMLDQVAAESIDRAGSLLKLTERADEPAALVAPPVHRTEIEARFSGYLVELDEGVLVAAALQADAVLWINCCVGDAIVARTTVAYCWSAQDVALPPELVDQLDDKVAQGLRFGSERTAAQDIAYGLQQLTDVIVRALSPGINDPSTAVHGIHSATTVLCELTRYQLGPKNLYDDDGKLRLSLMQPDLPKMLDLVCTQPRNYGAHDPAVLSALMMMLGTLAQISRSSVHRNAIGDQLARVELTARKQDFDTTEREQLRQAAQAVKQQLEADD